MVGSVSGTGLMPPTQQTEKKPSNLTEALEKIIKNADKDGDGQLNQQEFAAAAGALSLLMPVKPGAAKMPADAFAKADVDGDGKVSLDELKGYVVDQWQEAMDASRAAVEAAKKGEGGAAVITGAPAGMVLMPDLQAAIAQLGGNEGPPTNNGGQQTGPMTQEQKALGKGLNAAWQMMADSADGDRSGSLSVDEFGALLDGRDGVGVEASESQTFTLTEAATGKVVAWGTVTDTVMQKLALDSYGNHSQSLADLFARLDSDGNGSLTGAELAAGASTQASRTQA
ncbi:MAG TPA: EF-hand domain-containing protein [Alphaproteobacteria bacterium]|nr:EF-hand domain-containing protein [Alphaproteobacteria bacterium]